TDVNGKERLYFVVAPDGTSYEYTYKTVAQPRGVRDEDLERMPERERQAHTVQHIDKVINRNTNAVVMESEYEFYPGGQLKSKTVSVNTRGAQLPPGVELPKEKTVFSESGFIVEEVKGEG